MTRRTVSALGLLFALALTPVIAAGAESPARPRLLVLPWLVIDRTTNLECARDEGSPVPVTREARDLGVAAQAALDKAMHDHRAFAMIPRREWEPLWTSYTPAQVYHAGSGCAVCNPVRDLVQYDPAILRTLAQAAHADYVWLGVTVVPLTAARRGVVGDACCRAALGEKRSAVLARSSALLVRVRDGMVVWQQDARRLEREVPVRAGKINRLPAVRRAMAVKGTAHSLGDAFRREHSRGDL